MSAAGSSGVSSAVSVSKPLENMNVADAPAATPAASKTAVPPKVTSESPSVMVSKFGRRMDYKTAVVSHKSSIADVNKAPVKPDIVEIGGTKNMSSIPYPGTNAPKDPYLAPPAELEKNSTMVPVRRSSPTPIPNPLPTPKKHVPRELDFDITPQDKDMHFDLVDMNGKDFFDIN